MLNKTVTFDDVIDFSRPAPADYEDVNGDTQTAGVDVPRFNYSDGEGEGLLLDASLSEIAAINDIPNFNSSSGTWVIKADLDKSMPIPGSGFGEFMEGSGTLVFVYSNGAGKCWADGEVLFTVDPFSAAEPEFLSSAGLAKIQDFIYYPYAWTDEDAAAKSGGAFSTYFSPNLLFADGPDGFWGDSTDSATLFEDATGTTPAVPSGMVGFRLDNSKGLALGPDEFAGYAAPSISDGGGSSGAWDAATNTLSNTVVGTSASNPRFSWVIDSKPYWRKITHRFTGDTGQIFSTGSSVGSLGIIYRRSDGVDFSQELSFYVPPDNPGALQVFTDGTSTLSIQMECTVEEIAGNHQYQRTSAQKPTIQDVNGVQALVLDDDDDSMLIDVPTGGWSGTFVQGTALGVIVGEIDVPAGPYQIPTDPNFAGPGSDIHTVIVNRTLAANELNSLVEWVGQRCPVADFAGQSSAVDWFRDRTDLTVIDVSRWDLSLLLDWSGAFVNTNLSQQSYTDIVTAIEAAGTSSGTLGITGGSATTTGAAQTAVDALRGRGWTVTTPDGY